MQIEGIKPIEEWDAEIKAESLHLKFDNQLVQIGEMLTAKIPRVLKDLNDILRFPDAKKKEIYDSLVEAGEIEALVDNELVLPQEVKDKIDTELQHELDFYQTKWQRLCTVSTLVGKEHELRTKKLVSRSPIGTTYYVDFDNGNDTHDGTHTEETDTNADGPWATLDKVGATLNDPDKAIVRRGMTQAVSQDLVFANDGALATPIVVEADFDDAWGDEVTAGETATLIFGSKTVTFAGDISASIAAHKWIYVSGEDNREFAYEVESVGGGSNEVVTLYLPYKGAQAGAGKTIKVMLANPIWNTAAGNFELDIDGDNYWKFQGLHFRGTDSNGVIEINSCGGHLFKDCIIEGNGAADWGIYNSDDCATLIVEKCRFYNCEDGLKALSGAGGVCAFVYDSLFDGNSVAGSTGVAFATWGRAKVSDCEFKNHGRGDFEGSAGTIGNMSIRSRNCLLSSAVPVHRQHETPFSSYMFEDFDQVVGDNRQFGNFGGVIEATPRIQSETTKVRAGGGTTSIKCTPDANMGTIWDFSRVLLFEYAIYLVKDVAKTFTVYFSSDDDTDWDADPLNTELWIEAEYWGHATNPARKITKSTGVCNNFDADDAIWDALTVTITPLQTGVAYLRGYYCKTKEGGKSNIFYCDTKVVIS